MRRFPIYMCVIYFVCQTSHQGRPVKKLGYTTLRVVSGKTFNLVFTVGGGAKIYDIILRNFEKREC